MKDPLLEEAAAEGAAAAWIELRARQGFDEQWLWSDMQAAFVAGAEWGKKQARPAASVALPTTALRWKCKNSVSGPILQQKWITPAMGSDQDFGEEWKDVVYI